MSSNGGAAPLPATAWPWMRGPRFDVGWLLGSVAIVPAVLVLVWWGAPSGAINLGVTALVGGPHLFATYVATYLDPRFARRHLPLLAGAALVVPALVVWGTFANFQVLLSVFIFAASVHVLHQNAFLCDVYRGRARLEEARLSRWIDTVLLLLAIHPIAAYKLVHGDFFLGDVRILVPELLMRPATYVGVWIAFGVVLIAWLVKTAREARAGALNGPKTLLVAVTTAVAFLVPAAASGVRLELAFQAVNAWHSFQYLGLVWLGLALRREMGLLDGAAAKRLAGLGRAAWRFYGACAGVTLALLLTLLVIARADPFGIAFQQYYYMGVLSCLLVHYVIDGYLFAVSARRGVRAEESAYAALAAA